MTVTFTEVTDCGSGAQYQGAYGIGFWCLGKAGVSDSSAQGRLGPIHKNGVNTVFLDGHAEFKTASDLSYVTEPKYWDPAKQ